MGDREGAGQIVRLSYFAKSINDERRTPDTIERLALKSITPHIPESELEPQILHTVSDDSTRPVAVVEE